MQEPLHREHHAALGMLARRLVVDGLLSAKDAENAEREAKAKGVALVAWLVERDMVASEALALAASSALGFPVLDGTALNIETLPVNLVSEQLINKHQVLPLAKRGNRLYVGIFDSFQLAGIEEIRFHTNLTVEAIIIERNRLLALIDQAIVRAGSGLGDLPGLDEGELDDLAIEAGSIETNDVPSLEDSGGADDTPVVRFVNKVLLDAVKRGASDIHFEPYEKQYRVRLRMDGVLKQMSKAPMILAPRIASRLKVLSNLDIAERRVPQDGRMKLSLSKTRSVDFRVSVLPTLFGEKIVLRLMDSSMISVGVDRLGFNEKQRELYLDAINRPYGMVLVTGPTGSGKTVSLYTAIGVLNVEGRNISTIEDPVEVRVDGVNQVQQNEKRGMTFASALRSFLRQDPDVIMVGEIRDPETAEIAIKAAQTGHMVLSTVHTNDAPSTLARLMNMGIAPYNITSSLTLVVAQRLVRRLHDCKQPLDLPRETLLQAGFSQEEVDAGLTLYEAKPGGCTGCNNGFKGRCGIYQVMPMNETIQRIVLNGGNALDIGEAAHNCGVLTLRESALEKVRLGITSLTEIDRVTLD